MKHYDLSEANHSPTIRHSANLKTFTRIQKSLLRDCQNFLWPLNWHNSSILTLSLTRLQSSFTFQTSIATLRRWIWDLVIFDVSDILFHHFFFLICKLEVQVSLCCGCFVQFDVVNEVIDGECFKSSKQIATHICSWVDTSQRIFPFHYYNTSAICKRWRHFLPYSF